MSEEVNEKTLLAREELAGHYKSIINLLGEDVDREGLLKTPERVAKAMQFLTKGYHEDPAAVLRGAMFKEEDYKQMVIVKDIDFFSLCEHHMLPFFGKAHVAYIPKKYITGLSKIPRVVGYLRPPSSDSGAIDHADQRLHSGNARSVRRDGRDRGTTYVHADAWCREAKLLDYNLRLHRILPAGQNARRIYESDQT